MKAEITVSNNFAFPAINKLPPLVHINENTYFWLQNSLKKLGTCKSEGISKPQYHKGNKCLSLTEDKIRRNSNSFSGEQLSLCKKQFQVNILEYQFFLSKCRLKWFLQSLLSSKIFLAQFY